MRVDQSDQKGLLKLVERALELRGDQQDLKNLKKQLVDRESKLLSIRNKAFATAAQQLKDQDYEGVLKELELIDPEVMNQPIRELRDKAKEKKNKLQQLQQVIENKVNKNQLHGLLNQVEEYLLLKHDEEKMLSLKQRLIRFEYHLIATQENAFAIAKKRMNDQDYAGALKEIERIHSSLMQPEILKLRDEAVIGKRNEQRKAEEKLTQLQRAIEKKWTKNNCTAD